MATAQSWDLGEFGGEHPPTPWDGASLTQSLDPTQQSLQNISQNSFPFTKPCPLEGVRCLMNQYSSLGSPKTTISTPDLKSLTDLHLERQPPVPLRSGIKTKAQRVQFVHSCTAHQ